MAKNQTRSAPSGKIIALVSVVIVLAIIAALVLVKLNKSTIAVTPTSGLAPANVVAAVTQVPQSAIASIGYKTSIPLPTPINGKGLLVKGGKPEFLYMGADYCPYCAAQRWALVVALSHFGTFSNLGETSSSSTDRFPNTQTFSFHGTRFTSRYISFVGVELETNIPLASGAGWTPLDKPTAQENNLLATWDKPPYTPTAAGIPFVDIANKYVMGGASYSPAILQGLSMATIAGSLSNTSTAPSQAILASSNVTTATICKVTHNQPANVCSLAYIQKAEKALK